MSEILENQPEQITSKPTEFNELDSLVEFISICDIWKDCTHTFIRKAEQKTPVFIQTYTQVYSEFLHHLDNIFGSCYLWQKQYFDKLGIQQSTIIEYGKFCNFFLNEITSQMDNYARLSQLESNHVVSGMESCNNYVRQGLDWYAKIMGNFMKWF